MLLWCVVFAIISSLSVIVIVNADNVVYPCTTPDKEDAYCIPLFSCPGLMKSLATVTPSAIEFVRKSMCLGCEAGNFMVCCGAANTENPTEKLAIPVTEVPPPSVTPPPVSESKRDVVLRTIIPNRRFCGFQHTDDRFNNGTVTALDEFPWLVHVKFTDIYAQYKVGDRCTGVLITNKYVLTDTVCANPALKVRLGQYDVAHKVTCLEDPQAHECTEGTIEVKVNKTIVLFPDVEQAYSLSLIRLEKGVDYSDFVRPICLPLREPHRPGPEEPLIFSGWGAIPTAKKLEDAIKKRLTYDSAPKDKCVEQSLFVKDYFQKLEVPLNCFAPKKINKDIACHGDHGGPLMYSDKRHQWYVESVVVDVMDRKGKCSEGNLVFAVKITPEIIEKILDNIEP